MEQETLHTNPLLKLCSPILQLTTVFRNEKRGADLADDYGEQLKLALDNLERAAFEQQIPVPTVQYVKYAMAAYIDEVVMNSAWSGRGAWMGKPLQLQHFGEHSAGEGFFKRLSDLRQAGAQYTDVLEVYYICLQLGFEGMYRLRGLEQCLALQVDLRSQIEMARGVVDPRLATAGLPRQSIAAKVGSKLPFWVIGSVTLALIFFIYLGYAVAVNREANKSLIKISHYRAELIQDRKTGDME